MELPWLQHYIPGCCWAERPFRDRLWRTSGVARRVLGQMGEGLPVLTYRIRPGLLVLMMAAAVAVAAGPAPGRNTLPSVNDLHAVTLYFENDMFADTDRDYTNGVRLSWLSPDLESFEDWPLLEMLRQAIPGFNRDGFTHNLGLAIGQDIYTPVDTRSSGLINDDRPYAGWLYGTLSLHRKNEDTLHKVDLTVGVVGPNSYAEQAQNGIHRLRSLPTANGWDNQLGREVGFTLGYAYKRRFVLPLRSSGLLGADAVPGVSVKAGTVHARASAGVTVRMGWNVPRDFHGRRIEASGYTMPPPEGDWQSLDRRLSCYVFGTAEGHAVARNLFLDGNTFEDSHRVSRKPWVATGELGVGLRYHRLHITYAQIFHSKEFHGQDDSQAYGSVSAAWSF